MRKISHHIVSGAEDRSDLPIICRHGEGHRVRVLVVRTAPIATTRGLVDNLFADLQIAHALAADNVKVLMITS